MPVKPLYHWDESLWGVCLRVLIKGCKRDKIDVFMSDVFVKITAPPTYVLALDLIHPIAVEQSTIEYPERMDCENELCILINEAAQAINLAPQKMRDLLEMRRAISEGIGTLLVCRLRKRISQYWDVLCVDPATIVTTPAELASRGEDVWGAPVASAAKSSCVRSMEAIRMRREAAIERAAEQYVRKLGSRKEQLEAGKRLATETQWVLDREQRALIERRMDAEKTDERAKLYEWEDTIGKSLAVPTCPGDVAVPVDDSASAESRTLAAAAAAAAPPSVRHEGETFTLAVDFTPKSKAIPTRSRGDEDYYRRSRFRPTRVEDSPMFWKEKGDRLYHARDFKGAADAYTESVKRDGVFLTCVSNRSACWLHLNDFKRAAEDATLALSMLSGMPASDISQERYKCLMMKLHARRGAALLWSGKFARAVEDLRIAAAYSDPGNDADVVEDLQRAEAYARAQGVVDERDPEATLMHEASTLYFKASYAAAAEVYRKVLATNSGSIKARSNLCVALLQQGQHKAALEEAEAVMKACADVAAALNEPGAQMGGDGGDDSDDEEGEEGLDEDGSSPHLKLRKDTGAKIGERSSHVYLLLKAYVRAAAALCGMNDFRGAHQALEHAVRITPYDDDLVDDMNRIAEKIRLDTLVRATAAVSQ